MVKVIFELFVNLLETFFVIDFTTRFLGAKYKGKKKYISFTIAWLVYFIELTLVNAFAAFEGEAVLIAVFIVFLYALFCLKSSLPLKIFIAIFAEVLVVLIAAVCLVITSLVLNRNPIEIITVFSTTRVIIVIIAKLLLFYAIRLILAFKHDSGMGKKESVLLIVMPIISILSLSAMMRAVFEYDGIKVYALWVMGGIVLINIIIYRLFVIVSKDYQVKFEFKLLKQQYDNEVKNAENIKTLFMETKAMKHDIKEHLTAISVLVQNRKMDETEKYISKVLNVTSRLADNFVDTENEIFNAVVNSKLMICSRKNIFADVKIMKKSLISIADEDISVLFGNLFENAIEAAQTSNDKRITLDVRLQGEYVSIFMINSIKESVLKLNSSLQTTKKDKTSHGFGIANIRKIVEKYEGMIDFFEENNEFCCDILLLKEP